MTTPESKAAKPTKAVQLASTEQVGWLLARGGNGRPPEWITVEAGFLTWTPDANKALRLARREDADMLAEIVEDCERIEDHIWS